MCAFTAVALAGGATGFGAGATLASTGLLAGTSLASAALSDAGLLMGGFSAYTSYQQGQAQADVYDYQADVNATNAALREDDQLRAMQRNTSTQIAQFGALGVNPLTGSAPLAVAETAGNAYYDIFNDQFSSATEREALGASARNTRSGATQKAVGTLLNTSIGVAERYI
jgi:hypothetical protein